MRTAWAWWGVLCALGLMACTGRPVVGGDAATDTVPVMDVRDTGPEDTGPDVNVASCATNADCDDSIPCTVDECGPRGCTHRGMDAMCTDDGQACTVERCVVGRGCVSEPDDSRCNDMIDCTVDSCQAGRGCVAIADNSRCPSGQLCRADMMGCFAPPRCSAPNDPRCDDGQPCTVDSCDMATGQCRYENRDMMCDDGQFCNGAERCLPFRGCLPTPGPRCDDGIACTIDQCNEDMDRCENLPEHRLCNDGQFCNGVERCEPAMRGCATGTAPSCDDMNACTVDRCDNALNRCRNDARDGDGDGDPDRACGGGDCNDMDRAVNSRAMEACNGRDDNCNGMTDEGVLSQCGNCDPTCRRQTVGVGGSMFTPAGQRGTEVDPGRMGLVISAQTSVADYLWVPNTIESTMSKWDAATGREIARYRVGLPMGECPMAPDLYANGCNMPSRVAIDSNGDVYIANRGFSFQGTVTKVAADRRDCIDRNGNGMIDTSTSATPMPYGADECVLWTAPAGPVNAVLRAMAVDRGDTNFPQGYPWVGGYNSQQWYKLNPRTGAVMATVNVGVRPYGGIVTADGRLWTGTLDSAATQWVDTTVATPTVGPVIPFPTGMRGGCGNAYGVTADSRGRVWFSGWTCRDALGFDPRSGQWTRVDTTSLVGGGYAGRGITADASGRIYMVYSISGETGTRLASWDGDGFLPGGNISPVAIRVNTINDSLLGPSGVGVDRSGNVWMAHHSGGSELVRMNRTTGALTTFRGANRVYTYSDFTGSVRRTVIGSGNYEQDFDAGCDNPVFSELTWDADTPGGSSITFSAASAASAGGLATAMPVQVAVTPPAVSPANPSMALTAGGQMSRRHIRIGVTLRASTMGVSPVLRGFRLTWTCR